MSPEQQHTFRTDLQLVQKAVRSRVTAKRASSHDKHRETWIEFCYEHKIDPHLTNYTLTPSPYYKSSHNDTVMAESPPVATLFELAQLRTFSEPWGRFLTAWGRPPKARSVRKHRFPNQPSDLLLQKARRPPTVPSQTSAHHNHPTHIASGTHSTCYKC